MASKLYWPELYGFSIYGNGPTFVIYVEHDSVAESGGLRAGDRIVELDEQNVSNLSAGVIKFMARNSKRNPPAISVQSSSAEVEVVPSKKLNSYGFTVVGDLPVFVESVDERGPAYATGLRQGDVLLDINGRRIRYSETVQPIIETISSGRLKIKYLKILGNFNSKAARMSTAAVASELQLGQSEAGWNEEKVEKARKFYSILNHVFANESEKRKIVLDELKLYTKTSDLYKLATNLNRVLRTPEQRQLIDYILPFIPQRHQGRLKSLMTIDLTDNGNRKNSNFRLQTRVDERPAQQQQQVVTKSSSGYDGILYDYSTSSKIHCDSAAQTDTAPLHAPPPPPPSANELTTTVTYTRARTPVQKIETKECYTVPFSCNRRTVIVIRENGEKFGFTLRGQRPIVVESIDKDSPSDFANMLPNDVVLAVDGIDVEDKSHRFLIELLRTSGRRTVFEVMQKPEHDLYALAKARRVVSNDVNETYKLSDPFYASANVCANSEVFDCRNSEGKNFKEKINDMLNPHEKFKLKKYILDYNSTKNIWEFVSRANELLDTPAKQALWFFLIKMLDDHHQDYVRNIMNFNYEIGHVKKATSVSNLLLADQTTTTTTTGHKSRCSDQHYFKEAAITRNTQQQQQQHHSPCSSQKLRKMKEFASAPSLLELNDEGSKTNESDLIFLFAKQLDYLMNFDEKNNIKFALKKYDDDRDIHSFTNQVDDILDTPAKRTLWFHLIPLLDEDDQEYCKRRLCLPTSTTAAPSRKLHSGASVGTLSAMPFCKSAIRSYYYKTDDDKKNFYDDDFVLTDREIDNLFDLPENQDISSSRLNSPNRWPKSEDGDAEDAEEINFYKRSTTTTAAAGAKQRGNSTLFSINASHKWKSSASEVWKQRRNGARSKHLLYAETKTLNNYEQEQVEPFLPLSFNNNNNNNAAALFNCEENCEDYEIKIKIESNLNISLSSSSASLSSSSSCSSLAEQPIKSNENTALLTPRRLMLMQSKTNSNFYMTKDIEEEHDGERKSVGSGVSSITELTNKYKNEKFFNYQKAILELLVDDERLGKRFQKKDSLESTSSTTSSCSSVKSDEIKEQKQDGDDQASNPPLQTVPKLKLRAKSREKEDEVATATKVKKKRDDDDDDVIIKQKSSILTQQPAKVSQAPPPPAPPPLPVNLLSVPVNNSLVSNSNSSSAAENIRTNSLKRVNWEKIENKNLSGTLWEKVKPKENISQLIKYLDIDTMFARKKSETPSVVKLKENASKSTEIRVLNSRKAYNIAIVLASLKHSWNDVFSCLFGNTEDASTILTSQLIKHILKYYPDDEEFRLYKNTSDLEQLSIPDRFMYQLCCIPNSDFRLKTLMFKFDFNEKLTELNQSLDIIKLAIEQVKESAKLKNIIELILALGNYLNQGNERLSQASAFKLNVLPQLDQIRLTSNGAYSLMNLLAKLAHEQYPETIDIKNELNALEAASKVSFKSVLQEIADIQITFQSIQTNFAAFDNDNKEDNFRSYMNKFLTNASSSIDNILKKQQEIQELSIELVKYFGEDIEFSNLETLFVTINQFIQKFENAHKRNLLMLYSPLKVKKTKSNQK